jgi:uncharacterized membrane protein
LLSRGARAFARFWWDFLVGDTPELLIAVALIVALALLLRHHHDIAIIVLPVVTVVFLLVSTFRGRQREGSRGKPPPGG